MLARRGKALMDLDAAGREDLRVLLETRGLVPLLMHDVAALHIQSCVRAARQLGGSMAEAGVFMGGSARLICAAKGDVPLHLFDVFETLQIPPGAPAGGRGKPGCESISGRFMGAAIRSNSSCRLTRPSISTPVFFQRRPKV